MKKIKINLYPYTATGEALVLVYARKYFVFAFLGCVVLIALNLVLFLAGTVSIVPYQGVSRQWRELSPQAARIDRLRSELASLEEKKDQYQEMVNNGLDASRIMAELFAALPKNMWLTEINMRENTLSFSGYAVPWKEAPMKSIDSFMKSFQSSAYISGIFSHVNLKSSRRAELYGKQVMRFETECKKR